MRTSRIVSSAVLASLAFAVTAPAQIAPAAVAPPSCTQPTGGDANRPFPVCDVKPAIVHGPYLSAPTETSATIIWSTDIPSHSRVRFGTDGSLDREASSARDGMATVGRLHTVRLTGLVPGQRYQYRVASTPVLELNTYWPKKGIEAESGTFSFTTFDRRKPTVSFASISDTHASIPRIDSLMRKIERKGGSITRATPARCTCS
jgi:hypothetical protein